MDADKIESLSFEDSYNLLDQLIHKLEEGDLSVEEAVAVYEQAMRLAAHCERKLDDAEIKVTQLLSAAAEEMERNANGDD